MKALQPKYSELFAHGRGLATGLQPKGSSVGFYGQHSATNRPTPSAQSSAIRPVEISNQATSLAKAKIQIQSLPPWQAYQTQAMWRTRLNARQSLKSWSDIQQGIRRREDGTGRKN